MSLGLTDFYEVEEVGTDFTSLHCRHCGRTWRVVAGAVTGSWRCPAEADHTDGDNRQKI